MSDTTNISENPLRINTKADFEALFKAHYSPLCSYANGFLKDLDASEEVVQDVMLRVWTGRETLVFESSAKSYLFRAVRNGCMNVIKHLDIRAEYKSFMEKENLENQSSQEDEMIITELEQKIREAIDRLPFERRKVFIMSRYDGLTYNQIAEKLEISVKTVENQVGKALKTLREELSEYLPWLLLFFFDWF
jgi:RNA polymerase sigma-70 factor, ECF subfamily